MHWRTALASAVCMLTVIAVTESASAHGVAGKRFFPSTLVIEDPFVNDELTFSVAHIKAPARGDEPAARETEVSGEFSKRITRDLGLSIEGEWIRLDPEGRQSHSGFGNLGVGLRYQLVKDAPHEALLALDLGWDVGGTGRTKVEAQSFDVVKPALLWGKGFGDLPEELALVKPLALTGVLGADIPTRSRTRTVRVEDGEAEVAVERHPNVFRWGFVIEYSLPYLQSFVRDVGLPAPFNRMIPVVELDFQTPLDRGQGGKTTGTVNPGLIWAGKFVQFGIEAVFPVNERTGKNVGVRGILHFFIDDLFPRTLGRPLFGR
jgi:hypothetical protein